MRNLHKELRNQVETDQRCNVLLNTMPFSIFFAAREAVTPSCIADERNRHVCQEAMLLDIKGESWR